MDGVTAAKWLKERWPMVKVRILNFEGALPGDWFLRRKDGRIVA